MDHRKKIQCYFDSFPRLMRSKNIVHCEIKECNVTHDLK